MYAVKPTIALGPISQSQPSSDAVEIAPTSNRPNSPVAAAPTSISRPPAIISSDTTTIGCRGSGTRRAKTEPDAHDNDATRTSAAEPTSIASPPCQPISTATPAVPRPMPSSIVRVIRVLVSAALMITIQIGTVAT